MVKEHPNSVYTRCGVLDPSADGLVTVYDTNHKFQCKPRELQEIGILSGISDCAVTEVGGMVSVGRYLKNKTLADITNESLAVVTSPSDAIERTMKNITNTFKYGFTTALLDTPSMMHGDTQVVMKKLSAISRMSDIPLTTVGMKLRIEPPAGSTIDKIVVHNPSGMTGFNIFNSSPVYFEAHNDMDLLILMTAFLKHNGMWGEMNANMDLYKFDYAGVFFDSSWCHHERSFMVARAQLLNSYYKCKTMIRSVGSFGGGKTWDKKKGEKRKVGGGGYENDGDSSLSSSSFPSVEKLEKNTIDRSREALVASSVAVGGNTDKCTHPLSLHVLLDGQDQYGCIVCFSTLFYVPENATAQDSFVVPGDVAGAQAWIDERLASFKSSVSSVEGERYRNVLRMLAEITQQAHDGDYNSSSTHIPLGSCGRRWNWPTKKASSMTHEFILYSLAHILKAHRDKILPRMDVDFLYGLMNPFGKMLLLFMHNCAVLKTPDGPKFRALHPKSDVLRGMAEGKWWTVNFVGPSVWSFQITKCQVERGKTMKELACLETLQRLPLPGDVAVDDRLVFKGFCRGESLGSVGQVVSDITQSVKNLCMVVENRLFSVDKNEMTITSTPGVTDSLFSLEVTGFRPNRAPADTNSGRVNSRVMRILGTREGARVWLAKDENAIVFEKVNHDKAVSTEAMERAISHHRILYYDIETTTKNFMDRSAVITSIGFCLCTGGNIERGGTRGVFGLVAPGTDPAEVERQIIQMYPRKNDEDNAKDYDVTKHPPQIVEMFVSEFEMLLAFGRYVEETKPHVITGWNSAAFDDPFILTRIVKHLSCYNSDKYIEMTDPGSFAKVSPQCGDVDNSLIKMVQIVNMMDNDKISCNDENKYAVFGALFKKLGRGEDFNNSVFCATTHDRAGSVFPPKTEEDYEVYGGRRRWRYTTAAERLELANVGMFKYLGNFVDDRTGLLNDRLTTDLLAGANNQANTKFNEKTKISDRMTGSVGWFQKIMGGLCSSIRLDLMKVCEKVYKDSLSEFNLNAVLAKVSSVADRLKNVKDEVDLHYHLLGFLKLKNAKDQAMVHVYCCKDAYLTGVVSTSINKEGEIFRLSMDSALTESVVTANLTTPLCIGEGAICRNMGVKRADRRGVGIRRHSIATDTKGGVVSQPIVNHVPYQTIDMTSLYPMTMGQNNLCTSTFVSQRQVIELRDRMVLARVGGSTTRSLLDIIDECNYKVLEQYRPIDIAVASWKSNNTDKVTKNTRLERKLGVNFWTGVGEGGEAVQQRQQGWSVDAPPNMNLTAAGMDFFPEVLCGMNMQCAAKVNDDLHIAPASLEYMLMVLPIMLIDNPCVGAHITAGQCQTIEAIFEALEKDFNDEEDAKVRDSHWTFAGNYQADFCHSPVRRMAENIIESTGKRRDAFFRDAFFVRLVSLLDKIYRRVNVFDSADDEAVRRWSSRLINVGMLARTWNIKTGTLHGVIPGMQINYRADRVVMQNKAKEYAKMGDMRRAGLNKVGQNIMKLGMNSMYGCLALRARSSKTEFLTGSSNSACNISNSAASGGLGGGTRHSVTANQITENARCVFGNIGCCLQMALPGTKQTYGDTDSIFCVHNIVGDGNMTPVKNLQGKRVYRMDILLKYKMATIIPILVNAMTKGIRFVARRDAGIGMMNIAHERLAVAGLLFAKKTYHMLHFNEGSAAFSDMLKIASGEIPFNSFNIDKFASFVDRPSHAEGYVVPHNPNLIFRAAASSEGKVLAEFLIKKGITDAGAMREWFSSSPLWMDLDATVINNLYASKIVMADKGVWIDAVTSQTIKDSAMADAVSQANDAFTPYRKGAFVKNSIPSNTKLKGLQSLISRCEGSEEDQHRFYEMSVSHHVANFASQTTNPSMMITTSRVNKLDITKEQNRPNPLALSINNHLNPSNDISLSEKFKTVTSVSAWSLIAVEDEIPPGYFNLGGVRWNPDHMKGSVPAFTVKNLSVVPNAISTVYKMMQADKTAINSMVTKNVEVMCSAAANNGFSLRQGALSFNTGVIVTKDLAMACIRLVEGKDNVFLGGRKDYIKYDNEVDDDDDESGVGGERSGSDAVDDSKTQAASVSSLTTTMFKGDIRSYILSRLIAAECSSCLNIEEREKVVERSKGKSLYDFIVDVLKLDRRVASQMEGLIRQLDSVRGVCNKKKQPNGTFKSKLDDMVAQTKVEFFPVLHCAGELTRNHWRKCPISIPEWSQRQREEEEASQLGVPFEVALNALVGKHKCTKTCDMACCQSLYFVLLYTLALKFENERRAMMLSLKESTDLMAERLFRGDSDLAREALKRLHAAKREQTVKTQLASNYNYNTDTVVYLFEPSRVMSSGIANMSARAFTEAIKDLSSSTTTGKVWNFTDKRFFGLLKDRESQIEEMDAGMTETEQHLNFFTGVYHVPAVELAAACLSCIL